MSEEQTYFDQETRTKPQWLKTSRDRGDNFARRFTLLRRGAISRVV